VHEYRLAVPSGMSELSVTLNWLDPEGATNSGDRDLVNDLDLVLIAPDGTVHYPFTGPGSNYTANATATGPNSIDNVEQVRVDVPRAGGRCG